MGFELRPEILEYYATAPEHERLRTGTSQLEFARTQEIISRRLHGSGMTIVDVGGGSGPYSAWLTELRHDVHLVDPVPTHVERARAWADAGGRRIASCTVGDARALQRPDRSADVVLLLGPLYHLTEWADRRLALEEAHRVLVSGGWLVAAAISRFASALDGLKNDFFQDPAFGRIVRRDLDDGVHVNATGKLDFFTTAKFHRPEELQTEVEAAGFVSTTVLGIEGPGWLLSDFEKRWADARCRDDILRTARDLENEPSVRGISAHLAVVAQRP